MSLSEKIHQLNREIGDSVEAALADLRREISQRLHASNEEIQRRLEDFTPSLPASYLSHEDLTSTAEQELTPSARRGALGDLRDALARLDRARSQADILTALLGEAVRHASRAALLLVRGDGLQGWGSAGFGDAGSAALRAFTLDAPNGAWGGLGAARSIVPLSAAECAVLCSRIETPLPHDGVLVPIVLRDRVAAVLYADRLEGGELGVEALQILAYAAAQGIETLPFRERAATATLSLDGNEVGHGAPAAVAEPQAAAPAAAPAPPAVAEAAPQAAPEPEPAPAAPVPQESAAAEPPAAEEESPAMPAWSARSVEPAIPHVTEAMPLPGFPVRPGSSFAAQPAVPPPSPLSTLRAPGPEEDAAAVTAAAGAHEVEDAMAEEVPRYPRSVAPEPAPPAPPDGSPNATVLLSRSGLPGLEAEPAEPAAPPAAPLRPVPAPAAPPEEPAPAPPATFDRGGAGASGTPEVRPPSDIEGPGWAFAATTRMPVTAAPNTESMHEEARRLARLLVSEIKLYNEDQVEEGRRNRDIYERLKEDIDRSRQMYDERVDPQILRSTDYFYQELVRILAAGDSKALGI